MIAAYSLIQWGALVVGAIALSCLTFSLLFVLLNEAAYQMRQERRAKQRNIPTPINKKQPRR